MAVVPEHYKGREQTFLKHRVLQDYMEQWAYKLGSFAGKLWYVDCFAGPWAHRAADLRDTSPYIGIDVLRTAAAAFVRRGASVQLGAIFVEKSSTSFKELSGFVAKHESVVDICCRNAEFGEVVDEIHGRIGDDPALIFVDPKGWKGADMDYLATLLSKPRRDVLVNVMSSFLNRQKDRPEDHLREQMRNYFGFDDAQLPVGASVDELIEIYRSQFKRCSSVKYAADLVIMHPKKLQEHFRLVVGGNHESVLEVFRDTESKIVGKEGSKVLVEARERARRAGSGQLGLLNLPAPPLESNYARLYEQGVGYAATRIPEFLQQRGPMTLGALWPRVLERYHIPLSEVRRIVSQLYKDGLIRVDGLGPRERAIKDHHLLLPAEVDSQMRSGGKP